MPNENEPDTGEPYCPRFPDLRGQVAIVSGTSRGIGCGIASVLAGQGMKLLLTARSAGPGEAFAESLRSGGADCVFVPADLATEEGAAAVFDAAIARFGRVNLLVNNAAFVGSRAFLDLDETMYRQSFEGSMRMVYGLSFRVAHHMAPIGGGAIIHISSVGGLRAHRRLAGYDAAKGAMDALTRAMAVDLAPLGIRVNAVAPGRTPTRPGHMDKDKNSEKAVANIPLGRSAKTEEIGFAVAFLASRAAAYITGQILYVDGGLTVQLVPPGTWV